MGLLGILMVCNGALTSLFGIYGVVMAFTMPSIIAQDPNNKLEPEVSMFLTIFMGIYGACFLGVAILSILAGLGVRQYRGYVFATVALVANMATVITCYCFPTSLALLIFGLIVLLDSDVKNAFRAVASGETPESIRSRNSTMQANYYNQNQGPLN